MPTMYRIYILELKELHPTWEHRLWKLEDIVKQSDKFFNYPLIEEAERISPNAPQQFISDVVRYEVLNAFGGVWLDVDMDPQKSLDPLCSGIEGWICWEETGKWVNNAAMASVAGSAWLREAIINLAYSIDEHPYAANTIKSGPQYLTPIVLKHGVFIHPKETFYPYLWNELHLEREAFPDSYAIHRWNNRRKRKAL